MEDIMKKLTQATMNLSKWTKILNYWTIIVIIILFPLILLNYLNPLFPDTFFVIAAVVYLFLILIPLLAVPFIKDTQKQILLTLIRSFLGFIPPIALIILTIGPLALWNLALSAIFTLIGLVISLFILIQVIALNNLTKQLMKTQK